MEILIIIGISTLIVLTTSLLLENYRSFSPSFRREFAILKEKIHGGELKLVRMSFDDGRTIGVFKPGGEELFLIYEFPSVSKPGEEYFGQNSNILGYAELRRWAEKVVGKKVIARKSFDNI